MTQAICVRAGRAEALRPAQRHKTPDLSFPWMIVGLVGIPETLEWRGIELLWARNKGG